MYSKLDQELGERMYVLTRQMPFTNAVSSRLALGVPTPGVPMGDCAKQCNALLTSLEDIPGQGRLHRAISPTGQSPRNGRPGSHVLAVKETNEGAKVLDPNFLHTVPFRTWDEEDYIRSHLRSIVGGFAEVHFTCYANFLEVVCPFVMHGLGSSAIYSFDISPDQEVTATGLENAGRNFSEYLIRFVLEGSVVQVIYDFEETGGLYWLQGGEKLQLEDYLTGVGTQSQRQKYDQVLRPFELDLPTTIELLKSAPQWADEFNRGREQVR